jgi:hypothetical protein
VAGRGNGEEFGEPLDYPEDGGAKELHGTQRPWERGKAQTHCRLARR